MKEHPPIFQPGSNEQKKYLAKCKNQRKPYIAIHRHGQQYRVVYNLEWVGELDQRNYQRIKELFNDVRETVWKQVGDTRKVVVEARVSSAKGYLEGLHRDEAVKVASIVESSHLDNIELKVK